VSDPVRVGMAGAGRWGRHLLRNFAALPGSDLRWICDADAGVLAERAAALPAARPTTEFGDLLADPDVDAVVLATPVPTHHDLARQALEAGKHVFVEKPMTFSAAEARDLRDVVQRTGRTLMVGHLLRYHPAVVKLRELIDAGELGDVRYVYGNRVNLGTIRPDENALWSLGVHDVSVVLHLLGDEPDEVSARGECYVRPNVQDVVFGYIHFPGGQIGHLHLSWLDPHKIRKLTVIGSNKMAVFDDMAVEGKVTVHDKGEIQMPAGAISTHAGDIWSPRIDATEPLRLECEHFLQCVRTGAEPRTGVDEGVRVVEVLEAMQRSLEAGGETVSLAAAAR
jgi:predicted dehydrogenase